jgi:hypothetical protein
MSVERIWCFPRRQKDGRKRVCDECLAGQPRTARDYDSEAAARNVLRDILDPESLPKINPDLDSGWKTNPAPSSRSDCSQEGRGYSPRTQQGRMVPKLQSYTQLVKRFSTIWTQLVR